FTEQWFSYDERVQKIECSCFLVGYFQSERYFPANKDRFLGELRVLMNVSEGSERIADRIRKSSCSVSIHVRRGDYVSSAGVAAAHAVLGKDYYVKAMSLMQSICGNAPEYYFFSDDPGWCTEHFGQYGEVIETSPDPFDDLFLMALCNHHI